MKTAACVGILVGLAFLAGCRPSTGRQAGDVQPVKDSSDQPYRMGEVLYAAAFHDLADWHMELERGGTVRARDGVLQIDVPAGCCVWLKRELVGPVMIQYEARMIRAVPPASPGPNDRVSDLNCFWMATDPRAADDRGFLEVPQRNGAFATYNQLKTYYVGQGGNANTTTRFRRYIGDAVNRPLLPQHDLDAPEHLLTANTWQTLRLVACGTLIEYYRDATRVFQYVDPEPYTRGYFAIRTTFNHMEVRNLRVIRLIPR